MQHQLGIYQYISVWKLKQKIWGLMYVRDYNFKLNDIIEFDVGFFSVITSSHVLQKLKRVKGSKRTINIAELTESDLFE